MKERKQKKFRFFHDQINEFNLKAKVIEAEVEAIFIVFSWQIVQQDPEHRRCGNR